MQLTNNFYNTGYINQYSNAGVPKKLTCRNLQAENKNEEIQTRPSFKGAAPGAVPSNVASAMISVSYNSAPTLEIQKKSIENTINNTLKSYGIQKSADQLLSELSENPDSLIIKASNADITAKDFNDAFLQKVEENLIFDNPEENEEILKDELFDLLQTVEIAKEIKNIKGLNAFPLTLADLNKIREYSAKSEIGNLGNYLTRLNNELHLLNDADMQAWTNKAQFIADDVNKAATDDVNAKIHEENRIIIKTNGRERFISFNSGQNIKTDLKCNIPQDSVECMIKSNLVTQELFEACQKYQGEVKFKDSYTSNVKLHGNKNTVKVTINTAKLLERLNKNGISSLTSFETHVLTDVFLNEYRENKNFKKVADKTIMNSEQAKTIYGFCKQLSEIGNRIAQQNGIETDEHFYMRMIDRDLISPVDYTLETPRVLTFEETLDKIIQTVKEADAPKNKNNTQIEGFNGSDVNILFDVDKSDKRKIVSIM